MTHTRTARVVVDARMADTAGIGTYVTETLPRVVGRLSRTSFTVLGDDDLLASLLKGYDNADIRRWATPIYTIREQLESRRLFPGDTSLVWSPHINIPLAWRGPLAVTVHDVAHLALPQTSAARTAYARLMYGAVRRRASTVMFVSHFSAQEFRDRVGEPRRGIVSRSGVAERWFHLGDGSVHEPPYLLYVGNVKPHKNLARLLEAFARVVPGIPHRLVIIGRREGMRTVDHESARIAASLGDRVEFTGYVPPDELERRVAGCHALVLPSLYEGFGLPPLEALACGRAIAVSRAGSLPEVCGPEPEYFDPLDVADIARALARVATRPPDSAGDIERRRAWARRFDWNQCATTVADELRRLLPSGTTNG